ncbi:hypothetical protein GKC56_02340 [Neisseriaceae bacterium PsAf]|nr:hypothetical protein [Neisseriaceae bacterium PsAf]
MIQRLQEEDIIKGRKANNIRQNDSHFYEYQSVNNINTELVGAHLIADDKGVTERQEIWKGMTIDEIRAWAIHEKGMDPDLLTQDDSQDLLRIAMETKERELREIGRKIFTKDHMPELKQDIDKMRFEELQQEETYRVDMQSDMGPKMSM